MEVLIQIFDGEVVSYSVIICSSFEVLQYPVMRQVVLMDMLFTDTHYTMMAWLQLMKNKKKIGGCPSVEREGEGLTAN